MPLDTALKIIQFWINDVEKTVRNWIRQYVGGPRLGARNARKMEN